MRRALAIVVLVLVAAGLGAAAAPSLRDSRDDLHGTRTDVATQLRAVQVQLAVTREQLDVAKGAKGITQQQLDLLEKSYALTQQLLAALQSSIGRTDTVIDLERQLLDVARQTLEQVKEMNRKLP